MMNRFKIIILVVLFLGLLLVISPFTVLSSVNSETDKDDLESDSISNSLFESVEKQILQELKEQKESTEVYALLSGGGWGGNGHIIITLSSEKAAIKHIQRNGRFITRDLEKSELDEFLSFIKKESVDSLKSYYNPGVMDAPEYLYLHTSKDKVFSRVSIYGPNKANKANEVYYTLLEKFYQFASKEGFSVNYDISKKLSGLKILIPREKAKVFSVWKNKEDFRVFIKESEGSDDWREFKNNTIGKAAPEPQGFTLKGAWEDMPKDFALDSYLNSDPWQVKWGDYFVRYIKYNDAYEPEGIWLTKIGEKPILIHEGSYRWPVVIPESDWVIASKEDTVVKINLKTKKEYDLHIRSVKALDPIAYVPEHKKVLLVGKDGYIGRDLNEVYLFDIKTGKSEKVTGDFKPLCQQTYRPLQPTGRTNEYWAAVPSDGINTDVGRYNAKTFKFTKLFTYPDIIFNCMDMWVDTESKHIYVVINDDLLELPFTYIQEGN